MIFPPLCGHVFQQTGTIFKLIRDIMRQKSSIQRKIPRPPDVHVFRPTGTISELTIHMALRVSTRKNSLPPSPFRKRFSINRNHFRTHPRDHWDNLRTKFHEDRIINVASRVFTRQKTNKRRSQKLTMSTLCSGELKSKTNNGLIITPRASAIIAWLVITAGN
ncbi:hypothetical protein DPMN_011572, partial [Dreissena polymorpha]